MPSVPGSRLLPLGAPPRRAIALSPSLTEAMASLYRHVDAAVEALRPVCLGGGSCCRFDHAGHRLYVTELELRYLLAVKRADPARAARQRCPYQFGPRCCAREHRPLGCRTYFCKLSGAAAKAVEALHEPFHEQLVRLHAIEGVPYRYVEWTAALANGDREFG